MTKGVQSSLIAALIEQLPASAPFTPEARAAWLKMMAMAFDFTYGVADELPAFLGTVSGPAGGSFAGATAGAGITSGVDNYKGPVKFTPAPVRGKGEPVRYFIDVNGNARCEPGGLAIKVGDIPGGETLWDERPDRDRGLDTITWADAQHRDCALMRQRVQDIVASATRCSASAIRSCRCGRRSPRTSTSCAPTSRAQRYFSARSSAPT
jgi:hypothetical protein